MAGTYRKAQVELGVFNPNPPTEAEDLLRDTSVPVVAGSFATVTAQELRPLDYTLKECSWGFLVSTYCSCAWQALKILPNLAAILFTNMVMYSLLSYTKQPEAAAAFGMYLSYYFVFCTSVQFSLVEKFGQELSRGYGKKDYPYVHKVVTQGLISMFIMFVGFNLPTLIWADKLLILGNIDPRLIPTTTKCLFLQIFVLLVQLPADMLNAFCMAQGLESEISRVGIFGCLVSSALQYYLVMYRGYSCEAFVYGLMALGFCSLLNALFTLSKCDRRTLGVASLSQASVGLGSYICDTVSFFLASIGEFLGSNVTQYFIAVRHDTAAMAAFSAVRSSGALMYRTGLSLATVSRTRINILIGMGKHQTAKNFYTFYSVGTLCLAAIIGASAIVARNQLAVLFGSQNEEVKTIFVNMVVFTGLFSCLAEIGLSPSLVGSRAVGKVRYQILMNFCMAAMWHIPCCYLMNQHKLEANYLIISFGVNLTALSSFAFVVSLLSDWSKIEIHA